MNFILIKSNTQKCDSVLIINLFLLLDQTFCQVNFKVFVQRFITHTYTYITHSKIKNKDV